MRKLVALLAVSLLCGATALAQSAEKAAASSATSILFRTPTGGNVPDAGAWVNVLETNIKPPGGKDLFIGFSAVSVIEAVNDQSSGPPFNFRFGFGELVVRVLVDGKLATPGPIVWNALELETFSRLSSQLSNCTETDIGPNAGKVVCASSPSFLDQLALIESANTYNFIARDVSPGESHNIKVQAQFFAGATVDAFGEAVMGARTLTVEQVALDAQ